MSPQYHASDILCRVATPVRKRILDRMPASAAEFAIHGAWAVMEIERATDDARKVRATRYARNALKSAADLGDSGAAALLRCLAK